MISNTLAELEDLYAERHRRHLISKESGLVWITKDCKVIPIEEMTDEHLENTIKMLERNKEQLDKKRREILQKQIEEIGLEDFIRYYL